MSRRKQAKPRSLKRDEEWDDGAENGAPEDFEDASNPGDDDDDNDDDDDEEEELQRAFSRHSEDYRQDGNMPSNQDPDRDNQNSLDSDALGTSSSSWHSEDGGTNSRRGGVETPSSCATPTSASFPSEPEVDPEIGPNPDGNNPTAPYPCQFCDRTFPRLSYLKKHEQSHGDQMPYRCNWCARLFKHKRSRDRHVKLHTGDRRYRCTHCEAAFSRSDHLKIHMKTHDNQKPYQCTSCSRGYNTAAALTSHMQSHKKHHQIPGQTTKFDVDYGRRSVSSQSAASSPPIPHSPTSNANFPSQQKINVRQSSTVNGNPTIQNSTLNASLNSPLKLACMYCTRDSFTSMQQLQMHVQAMHQSILRGENLTIQSPRRSNNQESNVDRTPHRSKNFDDPTNFDVTKNFDNPKTIEDSKNFDDTKKTNEQNSSKEIVGIFQNRNNNPTDRPDTTPDRQKSSVRDTDLSCDQCTMKFSNPISLRDHTIVTHRNHIYDPSIVVCPMCGIRCTTAADYAEHYLTRHCENRRRSPIQPISTDWEMMKKITNDDRERSNVKSSMIPSRSEPISRVEPADLTKTTDRPATEKYSSSTLLCGQCGAALKDFESFREHLARHLQADQKTFVKTKKKHCCPNCDKTFVERDEMIVHLTKHYIGRVTKEYACAGCKKFFSHPDLLQRHLLDVHAHNLYRCALCRDTFDSRVAIQVHFAVKHSQECRIYRCNVCENSSSDNGTLENLGNDSKMSFRTEIEMSEHVRTCHAPPDPCATVDGVLTKSRSSTPAPTVVAGARCVFCGLCCCSDLEMQLHLASHTTSLYRCVVCGENFPVEFLLDRHVAQAHRGERNDARENGRSHRNQRLPDETTRAQKRGRSPASSNNNSLNQRDNNTKRPNYNTTNGSTPTRTNQRCEICENAEFTTETELQAHKKLLHGSQKCQTKSLTSLSMTCAYCGEICRSRNDLESHTRIQHASNEPGGRHKCNICDEVCPSGGILAEHKLQKHCKIKFSDNCILCRGTVTSETNFLEHVKRHSLENLDNNQRVQDVNSQIPVLPADCVICRQTLMSDYECRLHARHHLRVTTNVAQNSETTSGFRQKSQKSDQRQNDGRGTAVSCCLCLREFGIDDFVGLPTNSGVVGIGSGSASLRVCKSCYVRHSRGLPILNSPYEHARPTNSETKIWTREHNNWDNNSADNWDQGGNFCANDDDGIGKILNVDCRDDGLKCENCGIKFENLEEAEKHRNKEHGNDCGNVNVYSCIQCQLSFPTEDKIQQHVRKEHLESPNKTSMDALRCHLCIYEANSPMQLQGHLIEHTFAGCTGLTCYICQALFTTPLALQNHLLQLHGLGARPYDCGICGLKFFFRIELDHHASTVHRGVDGDTSPTTRGGRESTMEKSSRPGIDETVENRANDEKRRSEIVTVKEEIANSPDNVDVDVDVDVDRSNDLGSNPETDEGIVVNAKKE